MEVEPAGEGEGRGDLDLDVEGEAMPMSQLCWWMAHGSFLHYYAFIISLSDLFWVESCFVVASCHENRSWNFIAKTWQSRRRYAGRSSNQLARARHRWHMFRWRCFRASCHWTTHQVGRHAALITVKPNLCYTTLNTLFKKWVTRPPWKWFSGANSYQYIKTFKKILKKIF